MEIKAKENYFSKITMRLLKMKQHFTLECVLSIINVPMLMLSNWRLRL